MLADRNRGRVRRYVIDAVLVVVLTAAAIVVGRGYVNGLVGSGFQPQFYQNEFGPAVMLACGHGYRNPSTERIPALQAFLATRTGRMSCADLPPAIETAPLTGPQATWKYLLGAAAAVWWAGGDISWAALQRLSGIMLALTVVASYAAFRLASGPGLSAFAAMLVMTSPVHLRHLPHLRDYSKAPFMIAIGVILAVLVTKRMAMRPLILWSLGFGVMLGIGTGFRNDLLIVAPAFVVAGVFGAMRSDSRKGVRTIAALAAAGFGFFAAASPVLGAYSQGGGASMPHVALLGLAGQFDQALRVEPSPVYALGHSYSDSVVAAIVSDTAVRRQGHNTPIATYDAAYDRASNLLARTVFEFMPADLWLRGLSSMLMVVQLPSSSSEDVEGPPGLSGTPQRLFEWRARQVRGRQTVILTLVGLAFLAGAVMSPGPTLVLFLLTAYMAAYPALQFHDRHFFHLNVISLAAIAYLGSTMWRLASVLASARRPQLDRAALLRTAGRATAVAALAAAVLILPLLVLRAYQHRQLVPLIAAYESAPRERLATTEHDGEAGEVVVELGSLPAAARAAEHLHTVQSELIVAEFSASRCGAHEIAIGIGYDSSSGVSEFDRQRIVRRPLAAPDSIQVFFPAYFYQTQADRGAGAYYGIRRLRVPAALRPCLDSVARVPDTSALPLLLDVSLWPGWQSARLHQELAAGQPW